MQEKRYKSFKKKCQIDELLEDSTKIFLRNALERYVHRPDKSFNNGIHKEISNMCLSDLFSLFTQDQGQEKTWKMIASQLY